MNAMTRTALVITIVGVAVLLLLFASGTMTGARLGGGMMGNGTMGGISWMWIAAALVLGGGALLVWVIAGEKKRAP